MTSSIRGAIDGQTLATEVRLHRASFHGCILLVEGSGDALLYGRFVSKDQCLILTAFSREYVEGALVELSASNVAGVLGLVDRDYDEADGEDVLENIIRTEENDLEMMIICSPALDAVLKEYGSIRKINKVETTAEKNVRDILFACASVIGAVRVLSKRNKLNLKFAGMKWRFKASGNVEIDVDRQYRQILVGSNTVEGWDLARLKQEAEVVVVNAEDAKHLCRGHDVVRVLARALRKMLGSDSQFDSENRVLNLEKIFRLAYDWEDFRRTNTYSRITRWEEHSGFRVFASFASAGAGSNI